MEEGRRMEINQEEEGDIEDVAKADITGTDMRIILRMVAMMMDKVELSTQLNQLELPKFHQPLKSPNQQLQPHRTNLRSKTRFPKSLEPSTSPC